MHFRRWSNKIRSSYNTVFKTVSVSIFIYCLFYFYSLWFYESIFYFKQSSLFWRSHLSSRMLFIVIVYAKVIKDFSKLYLSFGNLLLRSRSFEKSIEYLHCSLVRGVFRYSMDFFNTLWFTNFSRILFLNSLPLSVLSQSGMLCVITYFFKKFFRSSQL